MCLEVNKGGANVYLRMACVSLKVFLKFFLIGEIEFFPSNS